MPQEPKKRHSRQRQGKRRASINFVMKKGILCPNCSANTLPHTICKTCGFYRGKLIINTEKKKQKETKEATV